MASTDGNTDLARMRRQAIISRYAVLDQAGLPKLCNVTRKSKIVFPTRAAAEACRNELRTAENVGDFEPETYVYICRRHFHTTRGRKANHDEA